jgi:hypothetical protein
VLRHHRPSEIFVSNEHPTKPPEQWLVAKKAKADSCQHGAGVDCRAEWFQGEYIDEYSVGPKIRIQPMYLYQKLFFGLLWLLLAAFFFLWPWWFPNQPAFTIGHTGISVGWACAVLGLYNFLRWWFSRSALARRRAQAEAAARDEGDKSNPNSQSKA